MKTHHKITVLSLSLGLLAIGGANATVLISFNETGPQVTATLSGTFDLSGMTRDVDDDFAGSDIVSFTPTNFAWLFRDGGSGYDRYQGGSAVGTMRPTVNPILNSGAISFGNLGNAFYVDPTTPLNGTVSVSNTLTWAESSLADIGLGSLADTPVTIFQGAGASPDFIQIVAVVPEPSSTLLVSAAGFALLMRRRR